MDLYSGTKEFKEYGKLFRYQPDITRQAYVHMDKMKYTLGKVPLGMYSGSDEIFYLDLSKSAHILIIGRTGSGKTTLINGLIDRSYQSGAKIFNTDLKGECVRKFEPLQEALRKFILKSETPVGVDIMNFYPLFFSKMTNYRLSKREQFFQFSFRDITKEDFITILSTEHDNIISFFDSVWYKIESAESDDEILETIRKSNIHSVTKKNLMRKMENIIKDKVLGDETESPNIIELLNNDVIFNLNIKGFLGFANLSNPASAYIAVLLRKIYNAKLFGEIKHNDHVVLCLDEVNKYSPKIGGSSAKKVIMDLLDLARSEKISLWFSTQNYTKVPSTFIDQARYIFIPYGNKLDDTAEVFRQTLPGEYERYSFKGKVADILSGMRKYKDGRRDFVVIDRQEQTYDYVIPFCPLSYLQQE